MEDILIAAGLDPRTPVDTVARFEGFGFAMAWDMEHPDEEYPQ